MPGKKVNKDAGGKVPAVETVFFSFFIFTAKANRFSVLRKKSKQKKKRRIKIRVRDAG